jgi:Domain of unknown function (DUF5615)
MTTRLRFLCDEDTSRAFLNALRASEPSLDVIRVGDPGAPALGTPDPQVLIAAETLGRCLISRDRSTMPQHRDAHFAAGRHTWGIILMREGFALARYVQDVLLIWHATTQDEWIDRTDYIPY